MDKVSPCHGLLPISINGVKVVEVPAQPMWLISPHKGKAGAAAKALKKLTKLTWPNPGQALGQVPSVQFFGHAHVLMSGAEPSRDLMKHAVITDQSDAWAVVDVAGRQAIDVLERVTLQNVRPAQFPVGATARCQISHMQGAVTRIADDTYRLMVFRSMAVTLVHELTRAMESVEALAAND